MRCENYSKTITTDIIDYQSTVVLREGRLFNTDFGNCFDPKARLSASGEQQPTINQQAKRKQSNFKNKCTAISHMFFNA